MLSELLASQSPTATVVPIPVWVDLAAVVIGSLSGVLYARERHLDLVGFIGLALLCGLGGGLIRDTIMQVGDVYMIKSDWAIGAAVATGAIGFLFPSSVDAHPHFLEWVDIISVGLFATTGTDKAIVYQLNTMAIILMGTVTGVGGGMLRDIFLGEVPQIFKRSNWYAICAIAGSATYLSCVVLFSLHKGLAAVLCVLTTLLLRRLSLRYDIYSPADVDLAPAVKRTAQQVAAVAIEVAHNEAEHARMQHEERKKRDEK